MKTPGTSDHLWRPEAPADVDLGVDAGGRSIVAQVYAHGRPSASARVRPGSLHCGRLPVRIEAPLLRQEVAPMSVPEAPPIAPPQGGEVRELRLAVVLYGGASLAIYMHGTTKELQRLVKASALADRGGDGTTASERVYGQLLTELAGRDPAGVRTRVVVDVV